MTFEGSTQPSLGGSEQTTKEDPELTPSEELLKSVESTPLPEKIVGSIERANSEILARFENDGGNLREDYPNVVFVLERSAQLPFSSMSRYLEEKYGEEIEIVSVPIGSALTYAFGEDYELQRIQSEGNDDYEFEPEHLKPILRDDFKDWLRNESDNKRDRTTSEILMVLKDVMRENPEARILIVDDIRSSGASTEFILPAMLDFVTDGDFVDPECAIYFKERRNWDESLFETLGINLSPQEKKFLGTFIKGSVDARNIQAKLAMQSDLLSEADRHRMKYLVAQALESGNPLIPLNTPETVELAGFEAIFDVKSLPSRYFGSTDPQSADISSSNPGLGLIDRYGLEALLKVRSEYMKKFEEVDVKK